MFCPQYETLKIEAILKFASHYHLFENYLPKERDIPKLPRQWIVYVCHSMIGDEFASWVKLRVDQRIKKLIEEQNLAILLDP